MNDRELLELAAKAAGINLVFGPEAMHSTDDGLIFWNPLENDGDALRLAVMLDIEMYQADDDGPAVYSGYWCKPERRDVTRLYCIESINDDPYTATRRAIVRAAAEIGRNMK